MDKNGCSVSNTQTHEIVSTLFGVDNTQFLYADVYINKCKMCNRIWIWYHIETEWHTAAGKWFLGEITQNQLSLLTLENAIEVIESLPSITYGGSYFNGVINEAKGSLISLYARTDTPS